MKMMSHLLTIVLLFAFDVTARLHATNASISHDLLLTHNIDFKRDTCAVQCTREFILFLLIQHHHFLPQYYQMA